MRDLFADVIVPDPFPDLSSGYVEPLHAPQRIEHLRSDGLQMEMIAQTINGYPSHGWKQFVYDRMLQRKHDGTYLHKRVAIVAARQTGKTELVKGMAGTDLLQGKYIGYICQSRSNAVVKLEEIAESVCEAWGVSTKGRLRGTNGRERFRIGPSVFGLPGRDGLLRPITPDSKAGRGKTFDKLYMDEAASIPKAVQAAIRPTLASKGHHYQMIQLGTAGDWSESIPPELFYNWVELGRQNKLALFEWALIPELDYRDKSNWKLCITTIEDNVKRLPNGDLPPGTMTYEFLEDELDEGEDYFRREYLSQWIDDVHFKPITPNVWKALTTDSIGNMHNAYVSLDVSPKSDHASISAAVHAGNGHYHAALVDDRPSIDWVIDRFIQINEDYPGAIGSVVIDTGTTARAFVPLLNKAGFYGKLVLIGMQDYAANCTRTVRQVQRHTLKARPHKAFLRAVENAGQRTMGQSWAWKQLDTKKDHICALVSLSNALGTAEYNQSGKMDLDGDSRVNAEIDKMEDQFDV